MDRSPTSASRKRTRLVAGCESCRVRHLKCDKTQPRCRQCEITGIDCDRVVRLRLKHELDTGRTAEIAFPASQRWLSIASPLKYHDETSDLIRHYQDAQFEQDADSGTIISFAQNFEPPVPEAAMIGIDSCRSIPEVSALISHNNVVEENTSQSHARSLSHCEGGPSTQTLLHIHSAGISMSGESPVSAPSLQSSSVHLTPRQESFEPFTDREAHLMRNFTENMARSFDTTDLERHFEIEVPRRALSNSMLRYAIFNLSSRHLSRKDRRFDATEALGYRNKAVQLLIPQLSGPVEGLTEEHLAAIIILRLDEEMDDDDKQSHLAGATKILNSITSFSSSGGLGEACAWLCLRQDIYVSIVSQQPLRTNLDNIQHSTWLRKDDDLSWANKIVLTLARILRIAFLGQSANRAQGLKELSHEVDEWDQSKPLSFSAIKVQPRGKERDKRLPAIWMLSAFHVLGMQYYHIARIVLLSAIDHQERSGVGFGNYHQNRKTEKAIREHLLTILGLATSNPKAENTLFEARHALAAWGGVLRHRLDQEAATEFLSFMQDKTGWDTFKVRQNLHELWHEDSE